MANLNELSFSESDLEYITRCNICDSSKIKLLIKFDSTFKFWKCSNCGVAYLSPRIKEQMMKKIYVNESYYEEGWLATYPDKESCLRLTYRKLLNSLQRKKLVGNSLLEIGCAYGYFLDEAKRYFNDCAGVELCPDVASKAKKHCKTIYTDINELPDNKLFDVIALYHVIEHVYDPVMFLKTLKKKLTPHGRVIISTPNLNDPLRIILRRKWILYKVPFHTYIFNKASLRFLFEICGFSTNNSLPFFEMMPFYGISKILGVSSSLKIPVWTPTTTISMYAH